MAEQGHLLLSEKERGHHNGGDDGLEAAASDVTAYGSEVTV